LTFHEVTDKNKLAPVFMAHGVHVGKFVTAESPNATAPSVDDYTGRWYRANLYIRGLHVI